MSEAVEEREQSRRVSMERNEGGNQTWERGWEGRSLVSRRETVGGGISESSWRSSTGQALGGYGDDSS